MKNSLLLVSVAILFALSSCSTQNKVAFGNRKFHPDPHPVNSQVSWKAEKSSVQPNDVSVETTANLSEQCAGSSVNTEERSKSTETIDHPVKTRLSKWQKMRQAIAMATILRESSMGQVAHQNSLTETNDTKRTSAGATIGFIAGLLSLFVAGIPLGLLAIILCSIALSKNPAEFRMGLATAGLILGLIGVIGVIIFLASK